MNIQSVATTPSRKVAADRKVRRPLRRKVCTAIALCLTGLVSYSSHAMANTGQYILYESPFFGANGTLNPTVNCFQDSGRATIDAWATAPANYPQGTWVRVQWFAAPAAGGTWTPVTGQLDKFVAPGQAVSFPTQAFTGHGSYQVQVRMYWGWDGSRWSKSGTFNWNDLNEYVYHNTTTYFWQPGWNVQTSFVCTI